MDAFAAPSPPPATVNNNDEHRVNGSFAVNGNGELESVHDTGSAMASPPADSPATPVSNAAIPDVKIDIDYREQESDVRHEPDPINISKVQPVLAPAAIPIHPSPPPSTEGGSVQDGDQVLDRESMLDIQAPNGEVKSEVEGAEDVNMAEPENGVAKSEPGIDDSQMDVQTPVASTGQMPTSTISTTVYTTENENAMEDEMRPAKRPRMLSDADQVSVTNSTSPPPTSPHTNGASTIPTDGSFSNNHSLTPTLSVAQLRFCQSTIRTLKKMKEAIPFLHPVDPVALGVPHYPNIIKNPMDFSTIERKLLSSNPSKPDPNLQNPRYNHADEFIADIRLIFSNCLTFNGPDHTITSMGRRVEEVFDKQVKQMPPPLEPKPVPVAKKPSFSPPPHTSAAGSKKLPARRASTSLPVIRRSDTEAAIGRPKREIHPPPPKDLPYADAPKKHRKRKRVKDDGTAEQLRFCLKLLQDLHRKQHYNIASPFYDPVDWVALDIPSYPKIIKKPMDMATMRKRLESQEYSSAQKFYDDFKLMIRNCFTFNPAGTPVNQAGIELQRLFDDKWKALPPLHDISDGEDEDDEDDSEEERTRERAIAQMESQIETMRGSIAALKSAKPLKEKKKKEKREKKSPAASSSKLSTKQPKNSSGKKKTKKPMGDSDVLSFEQKKELSEVIGSLDGAKLEKVIQIIHEGVPEIRDSTEEIELEIDLLPSAVLTKLYNYVLRPTKTHAPKRNRSGKGTGTGGLKRKSMDEDVEAEKIRQLEERMRLFEGGGVQPTSISAAASDHSSDSSSGSESSGSDSE